MTVKKDTNGFHHLSIHILIGMAAGIVVGLLFRLFPSSGFIHTYLINHVFDAIGSLFIQLMKMLVVPIVFVSLVCGTISLGNGRTLGRLGTKTIVLYLFTTTVAIIISLSLAILCHVGSNMNLSEQTLQQAATQSMPDTQNISLKSLLLSLVPNNPVAALAEGKMLQIIVFALLFGIALSMIGKKGKKLIEIFQLINDVLMKLVCFVLYIAPIAVFCLIAKVFSQLGFHLLIELSIYFITVVIALLLQLLITYNALLILLAHYNPLRFIKKISSTLLFAFSTSSSNASIPVTMSNIIEKLKVKSNIASFTIPLGATINMDGTAMMQGVATVFIANLYGVPLGIHSLLLVVVTAVLASIGTAGVPGVGLITLTIILKQVGLPVEGIAIILGVDRLLDMMRTAINVSGDCVVTYIIAKSEKAVGSPD